jgi:hypothetical protein
MYAKYRKIAGLIILGLSLLAIVLTPGEARILTILGLMIGVMFLLGLEKLVRAILGLDR